jgi:hypothetical protein
MSHIGFFRFFEAFGKGCPMCQIIKEDTVNAMDALLYEHVNDPVMRKQLRVKWLCNRHAWQLRAQGDAFGQSIIYKDLLEKLVGTIENVSGIPAKKKIPKLSEIDIHRKRCLFCDQEIQTEQRLISVLHENYRESKFQSWYLKNFGMCIPHLFKIVQKSNDPEMIEYFISVERIKITQLIGELSEFLRKHDYRFSKESFGKEGDAWIRAVEKLNGKDGIH